MSFSSLWLSLRRIRYFPEFSTFRATINYARWPFIFRTLCLSYDFVLYDVDYFEYQVELSLGDAHTIESSGSIKLLSSASNFSYTEHRSAWISLVSKQQWMSLSNQLSHNILCPWKHREISSVSPSTLFLFVRVFSTHPPGFYQVQRANLSLLALFVREIETICYIENKRFSLNNSATWCTSIATMTRNCVRWLEVGDDLETSILECNLERNMQ